METHLQEAIIESHKARLINYCKNWLIECFDEDEIMDLSDNETIDAINKYYEGGLTQFIKDGE